MHAKFPRLTENFDKFCAIWSRKCFQAVNFFYKPCISLFDMICVTLLVDENECTKNSSICGKNANCKNTLGSYKCSCKHGYNGNPCEGIVSEHFCLHLMWMIKCLITDNSNLYLLVSSQQYTNFQNLR